MLTNSEGLKQKDFKYKILLGITLSFILILACRLFYLQIFQYKSIIQRAQYSTSRISILVAPRGIIYDRNGKILATNKHSISLVAYPDKLKSKEKKIEVYQKLKNILKTDHDKLKNTLLILPENAPLPIRLQSNISTEEASQIVEKQHILPGIDIQEEPIRFYPNGPLASHVLGYISEIDEKELAKRPNRKLGDLVGKEGIEKLYDNILRGVDGKKIVGVDRYGKPIDPSYKYSVIQIEPQLGKNIYLTIDYNLQKTTEEILNKEKTNSAVIAVDPNTGDVLALANYPNYDPNIFTKPIPVRTWRDLISKKVFLNRAILAYVPGSIWKPVTLIAALDSMVIRPDESFKVSEGFYLGNTRFGDWTDKVGVYSLQKSLAWSRDTAFYQIGHRLKPEQIKKWGVKLGGGRKTGIELLGEEIGIVPDENWKKKNTGEPWYPGNTLHYSIGQGFLLVTPTQIARIFSAIANGNKNPKLKLVKQVHNYKRNKITLEKFKIDPNLLKVVKEGLEQCVDSGTGQASKLKNIKVAGKTGSAEVHGSKKTHSWFVAYAPVEKPEIVLVVIAEKAGHGGTIAAGISKKILEKYFEEEETRELIAGN